MNKILVFNSLDGSIRHIIGGGALEFSYHLPEPLEFDEPYLARLLWVQPRPGGAFYIQPDFVAPQIVGNRYERFLATSGATQTPFWVPLASNQILQTGLIVLRPPAGGPALTRNTRYRLAIELLPKRLVYPTHGAQGQN